MSYPRWTVGYDGFDTPYDLGWAHAVEAYGPERPKPGCVMTRDEYEEYCDGFYAAKRELR